MMNLAEELLSFEWLILGWIGYTLMMLWAVKTAPWYKVKHDRAAQNIWFAMALVIVIVWSISASIDSGFSFHFLLMTVVTLMFGPQFALMTMTLGLLGVLLNDGIDWVTFGVNALLMGWLPIMLTWWIYKLAYRYLDRNFFVYIFLNGFLAGGLSVLVAMLFAAFVMWSGGVDADMLKQSFLPYIVLMVFPEAFLNGFIIAGLVIMKPQWVSTFSDHDYLKGK